MPEPGLQSLIWTGLGAVSLWLFRQLWDVFAERRIDDRKSVTELSEKVAELTVATIEFKVELRFLREQYSRIGKIGEDVNAAHAKIRAIEAAKVPRDS